MNTLRLRYRRTRRSTIARQIPLGLVAPAPVYRGLYWPMRARPVVTKKRGASGRRPAPSVSIHPSVRRRIVRRVSVALQLVLSLQRRVPAEVSRQRGNCHAVQIIARERARSFLIAAGRFVRRLRAREAACRSPLARLWFPARLSSAARARRSRLHTKGSSS
jgi:hypothetical protein